MPSGYGLVPPWQNSFAPHSVLPTLPVWQSWRQVLSAQEQVKPAAHGQACPLVPAPGTTQLVVPDVRTMAQVSPFGQVVSSSSTHVVTGSQTGMGLYGVSFMAAVTQYVSVGHDSRLSQQ